MKTAEVVPALNGPDQQRISSAINDLADWIEDNGDAGTDPYDALNSPFARAAGLFGRWGRIAFLQLARRSPFNVRRLLLIRPGINPKGMGLLAQAYLALYRTRGEGRYLCEAHRRLEWLASHAVPCGEGVGWGYHFDWAARAFFVPRNIPTVVNTSTIGKAFLSAYHLTKEARYLETAQLAAFFILSALNRTESPEGLCFSYTPVDRAQVFNASLMGASLLAQSGEVMDGDPSFLEPARRATEFVLTHQKVDGSWSYGLAPFHGWTDGYHTGFILRNLGEIRRATGWEEIGEPLRRGAAFYAERLVAEDGRPVFRLDSAWPADIHACAEAILVFSDLNLQDCFEKPPARAVQVAQWTLDNLRRADGAFGYVKSPRRTDWTPHIRWGEAWMLLALSRLEEALLCAEGR